ncbi:hypothetical protein C0Q70_06702 [Pomacea canaliculata]|uniref:G-protein coupled receptors family 1 profile domain-containing protein n=1 Tax=Pomacea canaliculata TaxID=400727 RepID=A0A2T7PD00_POMCA|nr:uncharacterized protein LOC112561399 [Pomacea canaliculata]PVD31290.1 hypothetical protein C0Q70_06702 [Pomacea canaliculata]
MSLSFDVSTNSSLGVKGGDDCDNTSCTRESYVTITTPESYYIHRVGIIPVALLGIVGNLVSLVVWNSQTTYSATIFLFKYLAVWDTAFLVTIIPVVLLYEVDPIGVALILLNTLLALAKLESVHTTLLIAFTRWLAVYRPVHVHTGSLLTRRHVVVACLVVLVWCLAISAVSLAFDLVSKTFHTWLSGYAAIHTVGLSLPVLPLFIFNFALIKKIRSPSSPKSTVSASEQKQFSSRTSDQRLTITILFMSIFSVAAYTIGETVKIVYLRDNINLFPTLESTFELLQVVNSSVNFIFYFTFSSKFRSSFTKCLKCRVLRGRAVNAGRPVASSHKQNYSHSLVTTAL